MLGICLAAISATLHLEAPPDCDTVALRQLESEVPVTITASISANGAFRGTISLRTNEYEFPLREVSADRCEAVAEALALIAELAIARLPAPAPLRAAGPIEPIATARTPIYPLGLEPSWHLSVGLHGAASYGRAPAFVPSAPVFVELARGPWSLRATALWSYHRTPALRVTHLAARLEACPFHLVAGDVEADPCLALELGAIRGAEAEASVGPWLAAGAVARGRWRFAHPFFAELEVAANVPLLRPRFILEPSETVWRAPLVGFSASAGVGLMIW